MDDFAGYSGKINARDFNMFGFLAGFEFDFIIKGPLYMRSEILYRWGFGGKLAKNIKEELDVYPSISMGFNTKICIGVKVWDKK